MKHRILAITATALFALCASSAALAAPTPKYRKLYHVNQRQENQQDRIAQGINSGQLTPREAARLEREEARFDRVEDRDRRSGDGLSLREREQLFRDQNRLSRQIYRQKHDRQHGE